MRRLIYLVLVSVFAANVLAQTVVPAQLHVDSSPRLLAQIEVHSAEELKQLLVRAQQLFETGSFNAGDDAPIAFILHGKEAQALLRPNYQNNKSLVDLTARLSAFRVVDVKVCKTWMGSKGLDESQLPPFISTVPYGPDEERRLMQEQGYVYF